MSAHLPKRIAVLSVFAVSLTVLLSGAHGAGADVVFDNFDSGGGFSPTDNTGAAFATRSGASALALRAAAQFTVTGANYTLDSVTLPISVTKSGVSGNFLRVRITTDAAGTPGTTLEVLSENQAVWPTLSNPFTTTTTVASTAHPLLSNGTSYWIVTELTAFPAGNPMTLDYRWFDNTTGATKVVPFRQQQTTSGTLPSDPWTGFSGTLSVAFRVDGTRPTHNCPQALHSDGAALNDAFGLSVAAAGDVNGDGYVDLIAGAPSSDPGNPGHAYLYFGGPSADGVADVTYTGEAAGDYFGFCVSGAGDVNGDGYGDVIVGATFNQAAGASAGRAYVFYGGAVPDNVADLTLTAESANNNFGISVAGVGDVNGNGTQDVIVGAYLNAAGGSNAGRAYVYDGGPGADAVPDLVLTGVPGERLGRAVAPAGDLNGDGYSDFIVGAFHNATGGANAGRAYIYFGGPGVDAIADVTLTGEAAGDLFGNAVAPAGDVNGDGRPDVIVGAQFNAAHGLTAGRAYVFYGGPGMDTVPDLILDDGVLGDWYGYSVGSAGDINGDGYSDVVVGAVNNDAGGSSSDDRGRAYVYFGGTVPDAVADIIYTGEAAGDGFGVSVAPARKFYGPGHVGVIIGAAYQDLGGGATDNKGRAYLFDCDVSPAAVAPIELTPRSLTLAPNPATGQVQLTLELERDARVRVRIFDVAGRAVARPVADEWLRAGRTVRNWMPTGLPTGVYRVSARIGDREYTRALIWLGGR